MADLPSQEDLKHYEIQLVLTTTISGTDETEVFQRAREHFKEWWRNPHVTMQAGMREVEQTEDTDGA